MKVAVIGATDKPERFAFRAQKRLIDHGHETFPVSVQGKDILGRPGYTSVLEIDPNDHPIDTVTIYVNPMRFAAVADEVIELAPKRVIFNPGTESEEIAARFQQAGIQVVEDCTLVMLEVGTFEAD